jgi:hypothetical protein
MSDQEKFIQYARSRGLNLPNSDAELFLRAKALAKDLRQPLFIRESASGVVRSFTEMFATGGQRKMSFAEFLLPLDPE